MSAKYLADFVGHSGWARGTEDVYRSGQLLVEVLPRFGNYDPSKGEKPNVQVAKPKAPTATPVPPADGSPVPAPAPEKPEPFEEIKAPEAPVAPALTTEGAADWAKMSRVEAEDYRAKLVAHSKTFMDWCRTPLFREITLTDKQLETCQRVLKHYAPRSDEEKQKDKEKQVPGRPEIPSNEFSFLLLRELKLAAD